ncbi:MAG: hypothetical protein BWY74_03242 [Firmicutes bacterium ADurb.Bin419]|nr:MAG: hypothetical protein BWY74_03242 [Firmicutes bacterium ADurb.Bin419]
MKRRIGAWVLLAGFVLLIVNLLTFQKFLEASFTIYIIIIACYFVFMNKKNSV